MKRIIATLLIACVFVFSGAFAEGTTQKLHYLFDIPIGISDAEYLTRINDIQGISNMWQDKMSYPTWEYISYDYYSGDYSLLFNNNFVSLSAIFKGDDSLLSYLSFTVNPIEPYPDIKAGLVGYLDIVMQVEELFNDIATIYVISEPEEDVWMIPRLGNNSFDMTSIEHCLSAQTDWTLFSTINNISISSTTYASFNDYYFQSIDIAQDGQTITACGFTQLNPYKIYIDSETMQNWGTSGLILSIGEWECPDHIPVGEYIVTPIKSATIAVYRNGRLRVNEYLRTDENDEVGRLVLETGDRIEIGSGKLEFSPFK